MDAHKVNIKANIWNVDLVTGGNKITEKLISMEGLPKRDYFHYL